MAQESVLDTRLPYRIGYPKLPALRNNTVRILEKHDVLFHHYLLVHRFNDGHEHDEHLPTIVLVATFQRPLEPDFFQNPIYNNGWIQAVTEIRDNLIEAKIYNLVELIDVDVFFGGVRPSPILSSDCDIIQECNNIMPDVLQIIRKQDWVSIDVFHREFPSMSPSPTIIISARDANKDIWWDILLPELREKTEKLGIVLLFLQNISYISFQPSDKGIHTLVDESCHSLSTETVSMGDSCGLKGSKYSGTLGGKIRLKDKSRELDLGLTSCHVLRGSCFGKDPSKIDPRRTIVSISDEDHVRVKKHVDNAIQELSKGLQEANEKLTFYEKDSTKFRNTSMHRLIVENDLQSSTIRKKFFETLPRDIGTVYAESDFRIRDNPMVAGASQDLEESEEMPQNQKWLLDWGLIQMEPSKAISSKLPKICFNEHTENTQETYLTTGFDVTEYASISPGQNLHVMKRGRTTGWNQGVISAVKSIHRHEEMKGAKKVRSTIVRDGIEGGFHNIVCYSILVPGDESHELFLKAGDSGSLILLNEQSTPGVIVGLGFGSNRSTYASYMVPMDLVLDDIKESTGMEVLEPKYCGSVPEGQR